MALGLGVDEKVSQMDSHANLRGSGGRLSRSTKSSRRLVDSLHRGLKFER